MSIVKTVKKLVFGETLVLPAGLAVTVIVAVLLRQALGSAWHDVGGFLLLAGVTALLLLGVGRSATRARAR